MPSAVRLREDYSVEELRALARRSKTVNQSPAAFIAGYGEGMEWTAERRRRSAAWTARRCATWVHRFNEPWARRA